MTEPRVLIADYIDLIRALRARREALNISLAELDHACDFSPGTASKYLIDPPANARAWGKHRTRWRPLGPKSFGTILFTLGLALQVIEDSKALRQVGEMAPRKNQFVRQKIPWLFSGEKAREMAKRGGEARRACLSASRRSRIARKAAKARAAKAKQNPTKAVA